MKVPQYGLNIHVLFNVIESYKIKYLTPSRIFSTKKLTIQHANHPSIITSSPATAALAQKLFEGVQEGDTRLKIYMS
jgi:hypothetical protein